ncbi:hypothetical protein EUC41_26710 [Achromobacter denitrificans]|uniref:polysaccharide biosynthesis/export family protein n=1 Tax=Achromobacter denitrificans TaxID=32002 RepID=UPI00240D87F0|nr:polysaccharide biosynthesis/export family protein [Achromobacter denitrificans]WFC69589.1 hypothetical protein EUC41_26710 [Achromobacter denitrificans]
MRHHSLLPPCALWATVTAFTLSVSGCAIPGHYLGIAPPETPESEQSVADRADVIRISAASLQTREQARQADAGKTAAARSRAIAASTRPTNYQYLVGPNDVLRVVVWNHPELTNPSGSNGGDAQPGQEVNEDGDFFYPYVGKVRATGRTVSQIRDALSQALAKYLTDPQVSVSVQAFRSQRAFAMGQLAKPGVAPITEVPMRVSDLVAHSGGMTEHADLRAATLLRNGAVRKLDLYALYYEGDISQDVLIKAGDILTVPENRYNKVFMLGEVARPQSIVLPRGRMSLAEALSDVGGMNPFTSNAAHLYVIRAGANNRPQIWYLNAKSPDALVLAERFDLQPRDIVFVDPAGVTRFGRVLNNILPSATLLRATIQQP